MAHSHSHTSSHLPEDNNARRLLYAFGVTAGFMLVEVVGGFLSGSLALLADAGHMLTDTAALLFALLAVQFSRRPPTIRHTFGWLRLTTLAAFVNAIALVVITILIVWGGDRTLPHAASGRGRHDDGNCRGWVAGKYTFFLVTSSRQRREKPQRTSSGTACARGPAGFGWGYYCRVDYYLDWLDTC